MSKQITIYSTTHCPYCKSLKSWLEGQDIPFDYKVVDTDPKLMEEYESVRDGQIGVPFTVIKDENGTVEKILGFDKQKFRKALNIPMF